MWRQILPPSVGRNNTSCIETGSIYDHHYGQICVWGSCWLSQALYTTTTMVRFVCEDHVDWVGLYIRPPLRTDLCWLSLALCTTITTDRFVREYHVDWVGLYIRPPLRTDLCWLSQALCTTTTTVRFVREDHVDWVGLYIRPPLRTYLCVSIMLFELGSIYDHHWQICVDWVRLYVWPPLTNLCVSIMLFESGSIYTTTTTDIFLLIESGSMYDHHWQICVWESCWLSQALYTTTTTDRFVRENHVVWVRLYLRPAMTDLCVRIMLIESGSIYNHYGQICVWESCCFSRALYTTTTDRFVCENHVDWVGLYIRPPLTDLCVRIMLIESGSIYDHHWQICVWESCCLSRALYTTNTDIFVCENHVDWVGLYIQPLRTDLCVRIMLFESGSIYDHHYGQICVWESCCFSQALYTTTTDRFVCENHVVWVGLYIRPPPLTYLCVRIMLIESGSIYNHHWPICVWESCCLSRALYTTTTDRFVCENHVVWVGPYIRPPLTDLCVRIMLFMSGSMYDQHWQICVWESCWLSRFLFTNSTTDRFVCENHVVWVRLYLRPALTDLCVRIMLIESGSIYDHHWQICVWESCWLSRALYTTTTDRFVCENHVVWVGLYIRPPMTDLCVRIMLFMSGSMYDQHWQICVWESCCLSRALYTTTTEICVWESSCLCQALCTTSTDRFVCENHVDWVGLYIRPPLRTDLCVRIMLFESGSIYDQHWQICVWESCWLSRALYTTTTDRFVCENHVVWVGPYLRPPLTDLCVRIVLFESGSIYDHHWQICVWESCCLC